LEALKEENLLLSRVFYKKSSDNSSRMQEKFKNLLYAEINSITLVVMRYGLALLSSCR